MNILIRWVKFNLVGAMGMAVQLAALALLNRCIPSHYLVSAAAAVELTLLHNFVWHMHYTWRDRSGRDRGDGAPWGRPFVRFQFSNGLVSLVGNLILMRLLVHGVHLPLLVSNLIAIFCCSIANFCIGNSWAFAVQRKTSDNLTACLELK
jgi:putative flippase GtrA